jgi:hypothetical protein
MMRQRLLALAAAGAALVIAAPAAAQYYPAPPPAPAYGYGYGRWADPRALQARIDGVERQIGRLDRHDVIGDRSADHLRAEADGIERRLRRAAWNGLSPREASDINIRIARLEQRVQYAMAYNYGPYRRY